MNVHALRAPDRDGAVLAFPPLEHTESLLSQNRVRLAAGRVSLLGRPLPEIRDLARAGAWQQVQDYYAETGEPLPSLSHGPWLVGGHQPELFHPGVWLKNFILNRLGRRLKGTALNLVVDNDTARHASLRLPAGREIITLPFDHWENAIPFEEREVCDEAFFRGFPQRVKEATRNWPFQPILPDFWIDVLVQGQQTKNLAERFVRARRAWERRWGLTPLELPVSRLCRTEAFAWFVGHLVSHAPRLREDYNRAVGEYRHRYRLRGRNHPVPDLAREGDWVEVPLWGWQRGAARRGRLFTRGTSLGWALRCDQQAWPTLKKQSPSDMAASLMDLEKEGFKVRPRALSLTLYCRLCLGDLFVHGLGGGKYDEVTDSLFRGFLGLEPPEYLVVTGTLRLPFEAREGTVDHFRQVQRLIRDLIFNPQRHLPSRPPLTPREHELLFTKAVLMKSEPLRHRERKDRFFQMRHLNEALRPLVSGSLEASEQAKHHIEADLEENAIAFRRDYAFCLYPEEKLREYLIAASFCG